MWRQRWCLILWMVTAAALALLEGCGGGGSSATVVPGPGFIVCKSTYALCTTAPCTPIADAPGFDSCDCNVMTGYSVGLPQCQGLQDTGEGVLDSSVTVQ
jgi:hypothetical protein